MTDERDEWTPEQIHLPGPSYWPVVLALGLTIAAAGLLIHMHVDIALLGMVIALLGLAITIGAMIGWGTERGHQQSGEES